eukprot:2673363-Amphidinium_carterae.1
MEGQVFLAAVAIGLGSFVTEGMMSILLHDSRLLQQLPECLTAVQARGWISWSPSDHVRGSEVPTQQSLEAAGVASAARAYLDKKIFISLEQPPWCMLTKGSVDALISNVMHGGGRTFGGKWVSK